MNSTNEQDSSTIGTVEWFDDESGVGAIRPDDGTPVCEVRSKTLRECHIDSLASGDRVRFRVHDENGERVATNLALLRAVQRWEDEGGAIRPDDSKA
ncbi:MAG: hypothetical protein GEU90_21695 [Gemmatimonas sp.]|nr:hypothetical protein [Gemmatimonas sp.]